MTSNDRTSPVLGPSDSSDSAADLMGVNGSTQWQDGDDLEGADAGAATDRNGTGERSSAGTEEIQDAADIGFDRVVAAGNAGLGGGLDQAEEAQLGITDEELADLDDEDL